jgi:hypothetical protein
MAAYLFNCGRGKWKESPELEKEENSVPQHGMVKFENDDLDSRSSRE